MSRAKTAHKPVPRQNYRNVHYCVATGFRGGRVDLTGISVCNGLLCEALGLPSRHSPEAPTWGRAGIKRSRRSNKMLRSQVARQAKAVRARGLVRSFASEAKEEAAKEVAPVVVKKGGSSFMQRVVSFAVGVSVGAGYGLYVLADDVDKSTQEIQTTIGSLKDEMLSQNAALTKRIEALEKSQ
ncbi:hypothetical protein BBJ28_00003389 [Nothophytophthora sp. Chile5]|nr:hypothetical protein BBJ28_00003389 [Nothophytophthora sp. Chile5]